YYTRFRDSRNLLSFPTRRSSDLKRHDPLHRHHTLQGKRLCRNGIDHENRTYRFHPGQLQSCGPQVIRPTVAARCRKEHWCHYKRSEEHTSELQSRENLVCRLLLE